MRLQNNWCAQALLAGAVPLAVPVFGAAAATAPPPPVVEVSALRDADEMPYRRLLRGLDAFDKYHALAPRARLHYKLFAKAPAQDHGQGQAQALAVQLRGEHGVAPLAVDPDGSFALPRDDGAAADNATVRSNRRDGSLIWRVDVRTPGLAPHQRRLGDLRLECEVNREVDLLHGYKPPLWYVLNAATDVCQGGGWLDVAERPLFGVTMRDGAREQQLFSEQLYQNKIPAVLRMFYDPVLSERTYWVHIGNQRWPDDTVLEFDYLEDAPAVATAQP